MLRNILNNRVFKAPISLRSPILKEYLCVRESFNLQSRKKSSQTFQSLSKQYGLNSEQLISLISLLRLNPNGYKHYLSYNEFEEKSEEWQRQYRLSGYFFKNESLEVRQRTLSLQYPEVVKYMNEPSERLNGVKTLEKIIFEEGATVEEKMRTGREGFKEMERRLRYHLEEFKNKDGYRNMKIVIETIIENSKIDFRRFLIDAKVFLDSFGKNELRIVQTKAISETQKIKEKEQIKEKELQKERRKTLGLSVKDIEELDNIESIELQRFMEEINQPENSVALATWVNDRKLVFEGQKIDYKQLLRNGLLISFLGIAAISAFLFVLYQGDGRYLTLLTLPTLGFLGRKNLRILEPSYLQRIWIHRDGKHMDLETVSLRGLALHKDVAINEFKVWKEGNVSVNLEKSFLEESETNKTLNFIRKQNLLIHPSFYFETKEVNGFVPVENDKNKFVWEKILKGAEFETKQV